ncbi:unnamed protein product [Dicrocoelium dendriticum]|nr:unnamed protein product [Dicrocoelium dendriticum]
MIPLRMEWDKMSKSKLNGVDPTDVVRIHGIELIRLAVMSNVGPHRARKWQEDGVLQGLVKWQNRLLRLVDDVLHWVERLSSEQSSWILLSGPDDPLHHLHNTRERIIQRVNTYYDESFVLSAVIARLQELTDLLKQSAMFSGGPGAASFVHFRSLSDLIVMLAPMAPILACELWSRLQLACQMQAAGPAREALSVLADSSSTIASSSDSWPYDLSKLVLEQPFPQCPTDFQVVSDPLSARSSSECDEKSVEKLCT